LKLEFYITLIFIIYTFPISVLSQKQVNTPVDSLSKSIATDTIPKFEKPSPLADTTDFKENLTTTEKQVSFSKDSLDAIINYGARDTQWYDHKLRVMHLYGEAYVEYEQMKLTAGYIIFDMENNIASAFSIKDEHGHVEQRPTFNDGEREFTYNQLKYNFKKKKGIVFDAITQEGSLFVHGARTKYVSAENDSIYKNDIIYQKDALITSCNHPHPHYGIRSNKMKVVTDKVAVIGPSNLEIAGVPTPLWVPFGFFPLTEGESSGFLFPEDFRYSPEQGFGIEGIGWYFPINDYMNLIARGDYYTNGSHGIRLTSNYKKLYKYSGSVTVRYNDQLVENDLAYLTSNKSYALALSHNQDSKAHPYRKLGGSINFQVNNYAATVGNDASSVLNNVYSSNFSFSHTLPRTPFSLSVGLRHSQNTRNNTIDITLPDVQLRMNTIFPFKNKRSSGAKEKWYEKIGFKYNSEVKNFIASTDSTIFTSQVFDDMRYGVGNSFESNASFRVLKYFNITPSAKYNEDWVFQKAEKEWIYLKNAEGLDSIDRVETNYIDQFQSYRDFDLGVGINTQIFGTIPGTNGWFRGLRHTIKPNARFNYAPDTKSLYEQVLQTGFDEEDLLSYSPFERSAISISSLQDKRAKISYGFSSVLEFKYYSKRDSTEKKIKILDSFTGSGGYNMAIDSFQYDKISFSGRSRLFKNVSTFSFGFGLDPYQENENGRSTAFVTDGSIPLRLDDAFFKLNTRFKIKDVIKYFQNRKKGVETEDFDAVKKDDDENDRSQTGNINRGGSPDRGGASGNNDEEKETGPGSILDWLQNINVEHDIQYNITTTKGERINALRANSLRISGRIPLTENWDMSIGNISYDFKNKSLVYPSFGVSRKLHCWDMKFSWAPNRNTYSFFIGVSNSNLNFLKYNYGQNNVDGLISNSFR